MQVRVQKARPREKGWPLARAAPKVRALIGSNAVRKATGKAKGAKVQQARWAKEVKVRGLSKGTAIIVASGATPHARAV